MKRIGIDTGGTFTDFVYFNGKELESLKLPSTPWQPEISILNGIRSHLKKHPSIVYGTTVATNAILQKKLARTAFLCTKGFEHILHIGRQDRIDLFSLRAKKAISIVPVSLCFGIEERTGVDGRIEKKPDTKEINRLIAVLKGKRVESVALLFLHSYKNSSNENRVARVLRQAGFYVTASSEILPEYREYERGIITVINAALQPIITDYIDTLDTTLSGNPFYIIQSNGGFLSPQRIVKEPVRTIISGPAGGVIAARHLAARIGADNLITLDMGGTSTDVSIIKDKELQLTRRSSFEHLPIRIPIIDIVTVGAGGGSKARIDKGGVLQVGPESAGAEPGPACYGKSMEATVTDAFVACGIVLADKFLGGEMEIFPQRSFDAIERLSRTLGRSVHETAEGIIQISISSMERALRSITVEKGEDPRYFTLLPFGGAGGMVATLLAEKLGINKILIPPYQGVFSALGMLFADLQKEFTRSFIQLVTPDSHRQLEEILRELNAQALAFLEQEGYKGKRAEVFSFLEMRYHGQSYELTVPFTPDYLKSFHRQHQQLYSYSLGDEACEIVNIRVLAVGKTAKADLRESALQKGLARPFARNRVFFDGRWQMFNFYNRQELIPGQTCNSPAVVTDRHSTVVVDNRFHLRVDGYTNLVLTRTDNI